MNTRFITTLLLLSTFLIVSCTQKMKSGMVLNPNQKIPSEITKLYNKDYADSSRLNWQDTLDFTNYKKGFIAGPKDSVIMSDTQMSGNDTTVVWDFNTWDFTANLTANSPSPESINPSLWRIAKLNTLAGLFEVRDSIYQIRNYDLSVMSIVVGPDGYIVVDPLVSPETALAGLQLFHDGLSGKFPGKDLVAVIFTHSHIDHFGGIMGVERFMNNNGMDSKRLKIWAPAGFMEAAVSENVYVGNAMGRRASYMYGDLIPKDTLGVVDDGLGKGVSGGTPGILTPTDTIFESGTVENIAGLNLEFIYAPNTEAPSEMLFYFQEYKAICTAEDATHTLHNLYTLRGAKTRDAREWVKALTMVLEKWGNEAKYEFNSHHWPVWHNPRIKNHLESQRAMYKFIHDQTLHYANMGYDMTTVAEILSHPPKSLNQIWSSQGYYGTYNHDVKATWNLYLGWFDGNPSNLHKLPAVWPHSKGGGSSAKYVEYMGGKTEIVRRAKEAYNNGEYRWVAEVLQHVVNVDTNYYDARYLLADAHEQMGYQAVSGPWRNFYLSGASELRTGKKYKQNKVAPPSSFAQAMTLDMIIDMIAIMVDAEKADGKIINFGIIVKDPIKIDTTLIQLKYSCLNYLVDSKAKIDFYLTIDKQKLEKMIQSENFKEQFGELKIITPAGVKPKAKFLEFVNVLAPVKDWFNLVTPNRPVPGPLNPMKVKQR